MNITPSYPNLVPLTLQPSIEAAKRDNRLRELVPAMNQSEAYAKESGVGSEKDKARSAESRPTSYGSTEETLQTSNSSQRVQGATEQDQQSKQQSGQGSSQQQGQSSSQQQQDQQKLDALKKRDAEVRLHEEAHQAVGGRYASSPTYSLVSGPDGNRYATGGEVHIDMAVEKDPQTMISKMQQVRAAALAPSDPSGQDQLVASQASKLAADAQQVVASQQVEQSDSSSGASLTNLGSSDPSPVSQLASNDGQHQSESSRTGVISQRYQQSWQPQVAARFSQYA